MYKEKRISEEEIEWLKSFVDYRGFDDIPTQADWDKQWNANEWWSYYYNSEE